MRKNLCVTYEKTRYTPEGSEWPPCQPKSIVSVALIYYKGQRTEQQLLEIVELQKEGSNAIDKLVGSNKFLPSPKKRRLDHSKISKSIADIFKPDLTNTQNASSTEQPKSILIEGAPGIGKTVLIKEVAYCWAKEKILHSVELVFLIYLRHPGVQNANSLEQLIQLFDVPTEMTSIVRHYLFQCSGQDVAFLMDGFDEYPPSLRKDSIILNIIMHKTLPKSTVVVTSRPVATASLHNHVDRRIEILGFAEDDRNRYISETLMGSPGKEEELYEYLKQQPIINALCFVPLHLAILLYLFQKDSLPETLTEMNESFILHTIYRYIERNSSEYSLSDAVEKLVDLPESILDDVYKLCALAFEGLEQDQLVFPHKKIKEIFPGVSTNVNRFGLLQAVQHYPSSRAAGTTTSFNFLHYTMQEFLAALHVSNLSGEKQSSLMKETFWNEHYSFMWMMYIGIVGTKSEVFDNFISKGNKYKRGGGVKLLRSIKDNKIKLLHLFQCYSEDKGNVKIPVVITSMFKDGKIKFNETLLPHHISSLTVFLSHVKVHLSALELNKCHLGDNGMNILKHFITSNKMLTSSIGLINLLENDVSPWGVYCATIEHCSVYSLMVFGDDGVEEYIKEIKNSLQKNTLQCLTLCNIGDIGLKSIQTVLASSCSRLLTLKKIQLSWLKLDKRNSKVLLHTTLPLSNQLEGNVSKELAVDILWDGISYSKSNSLDLSNKLCSNDMLSSIVFGLHNNKTVSKLDLSNNSRCLSNEDGITKVCNYVKNNKMLQELSLSSNDIGNKIHVVTEALQANETLQKLDISNNHISDDDLTSYNFIESKVKNTEQESDMSVCPTFDSTTIFQIKKLNIASNNISPVVISSFIKNNSILQELNISESFITTTGAKIIAEAIKIKSTLQTLDISKNYITSDGLLCLVRTKLKKLIITYNNVTKSGFEKIECCISSLTSVCASWNEIVIQNKHVSFSCKIFEFTNSLKSYLGDETWPIEEISDLDYRVKILTDCLEEDTVLLELDLCNHNINTDRAKMVAKATELNTVLQKLDISCNALSDDGALAFSGCLKHNKSLQELSMSGNMISNEGAIWIAEGMKNNRSLSKLDISKNWITSKALLYLLEALKDNFALKFLNITHNNVTKSEFVKFNQSIKHLLLQIQIKLSWNEIDCNSQNEFKSICKLYDPHIKDFNDNETDNWSFEKIIDNDVRMEFLSNTLGENNNLLILNLSNNNISDVGASLIAQAIEKHSTLKVLNVSHNKLSDDGVSDISICLRRNNVLQRLDMSENQIAGKGAYEIATLIEKNKSLKVLDISYMCISDDGVTEISRCLKENNSLLELNLSLNKITSIGAEEIAKALEDNSTLRILNITGNKISDNGASAICTCLKDNHCLQELYMSEIDISGEGAACIADAIEYNKCLHTLHLHHHKIDNSLSFNMTILNAVHHHNNTLKELKLPWVYGKDEEVVSDKIKKMKKGKGKFIKFC